MDIGAKRTPIHLKNKRSFIEVIVDIIVGVDQFLFGEPKTASFEALA